MPWARETSLHPRHCSSFSQHQAICLTLTGPVQTRQAACLPALAHLLPGFAAASPFPPAFLKQGQMWGLLCPHQNLPWESKGRSGPVTATSLCRSGPVGSLACGAGWASPAALFSILPVSSAFGLPPSSATEAVSGLAEVALSIFAARQCRNRGGEIGIPPPPACCLLPQAHASRADCLLWGVTHEREALLCMWPLSGWPGEEGVVQLRSDGLGALSPADCTWPTRQAQAARLEWQAGRQGHY